MRPAIEAALKRYLPRPLSLAMRVLPARRMAAVYGIPAGEGNAVEILRFLAEHYTGRIVWLVRDPNDVPRWQLANTPGHERIGVYKHLSLRGVWSYLLSEAVFYTHGLFEHVYPSRNRTFVNVWHGDGLKRTVAEVHANYSLPSSLLVSGTRVWGVEKASAFGMSLDQLVVCGNPRIDQLFAGDAVFIRLGLPTDRPLVVWAPTYRDTVGIGSAQGWQDAPPLREQHALQASLRSVPQRAERAGVHLVVKPHRLDTEDYAAYGATVIADKDLVNAHLTPYHLLGAASALITDYSSIWTDFLACDKPIGYFCPDLDGYAKGRGFGRKSFMEHLAGPLIEDEAQLDAFFTGIARSEDPSRDLRQQKIDELGAVTESGATARLFSAVDRYRSEQGLPELLDPPSPTRG